MQHSTGHPKSVQYIVTAKITPKLLKILNLLCMTKSISSGCMNTPPMEHARCFVL